MKIYYIPCSLSLSVRHVCVLCISCEHTKYELLNYNGHVSFVIPSHLALLTSLYSYIALPCVFSVLFAASIHIEFRLHALIALSVIHRHSCSVASGPSQATADPRRLADMPCSCADSDRRSVRSVS